MAIIATKGKGGDYKPCPVGVQQGVCIDIIDHGIVEVTYNGETKRQHKVTIRFASELEVTDGEFFQVQRRFTLSLHKKSSLRPFLDSWRGRPFTEEEAEGFDLEVLLGVNAMLNVMHEESEGKTYARIAAVMPVGKNTPKLPIPAGYVRVCDRKDKPEHPLDAEEDEVPF